MCNESIEVRVDHGLDGIGQRGSLIGHDRRAIPIRQVDRESDVRGTFGICTFFSNSRMTL